MLKYFLIYKETHETALSKEKNYEKLLIWNIDRSTLEEIQEFD